MHDKPLLSAVTGMPFKKYQPVKKNQHFIPDKVTHHENLIHITMAAIKPGYCNILFMEYEKKRILDYMVKIRN